MSWDQLLDIFKVDQQEREQLASMPPQACPHDGEPLQQGPHGELFCPSDGWVWTGVR
jgi:uncharacterized Zn finger protein (UPF0148 family)